MKAFAAYSCHRRAYEVTLSYSAAGRDLVVQPVNMEVRTYEPNEISLGPSFTFDPDTAQSLFQSLWDAGLRPEDGSGGKAEVNALKAHIAFAEHVAKTTLERAVQPPIVVNQGCCAK